MLTNTPSGTRPTTSGISSGPAASEEIRVRVAGSIDAFLARQRPGLEAISPDIAELVDVIEAFVSGGKRLRALFLYWGWRAVAGVDSSPGAEGAEEVGSTGPADAGVITAAAAMEFLQACALIHDDVMDRSDVRRGAPAVHRRFGDRHAHNGWAGGPHDFGTGAAILVGDLCLSWADEMLLSSDLPAEALRRGKAVYDTMRTELMAGQYLDILEQARRNPSVESALRVATYKSAKYSIERPLQIGAAIAGADAQQMDALARYGVSLGLAFQLRDDLLGVFGNPAATGKPAGDDLREGKRTALVALTLQGADERQRTAFESGFGDRDADPGTIAALTDIVVATGARDQVERMVADYAYEAVAAIGGARLDPVAAAQLRDLIDAAARRDA